MSPGSGAGTRATFGAAFILIAESAILAGWTTVSIWTTPICWWGYLLVLDALVEARTGRSLLAGPADRILGWVVLSVLFWLLFEGYNLRLRNWEYVGLPGNRASRWAGYFASFGTILPGLFLTSAALRSLGAFAKARCRPWRPSRRGLRASVGTGAVCLLLPPVVPAGAARYLFGPVWIGLILVLEPLNRSLAGPSILRDLERGAPGRALRLLLAGYLCGFLWEFWNYWAAAKWIYHVPFVPEVRIFEMPILGFLGFGPFALEYYAMYGTARVVWQRLRRRKPDVEDPAAIIL